MGGPRGVYFDFFNDFLLFFNLFFIIIFCLSSFCCIIVDLKDLGWVPRLNHRILLERLLQDFFWCFADLVFESFNGFYGCGLVEIESRMENYLWGLRLRSLVHVSCFQNSTCLKVIIFRVPRLGPRITFSRLQHTRKTLKSMICSYNRLPSALLPREKVCL